MTKSHSKFIFHSIDAVFAQKSSTPLIPIRVITQSDFEDIHQRASVSFSRQMEQVGFAGKDRQICILRDDKAAVVEILVSLVRPLSLYAFSAVFEKLRADFSGDFLKSVVFQLDQSLSQADATQATMGWALASYRFDRYKKDKVKDPLPVLIWPVGVNADRIRAVVEGLCLVRSLINTPPNDMGTDELAAATADVARAGNAVFQKIVDKDLLTKNFPMIYAVGQASPRRPQLLEFDWGDDAHPRVTLVGKGVVFDTGGLDLKPPPFMLLMKKDMGGAAHVLGLAHIIMALKLPVRLRVIIAAAENSVGGEAFRPGDILNSRKGLTVEIGDTDAEGRLVVGDALAYACEGDSKPDLLVDYCTLTGSARAALGYDIPAFFSNKDSLLDELKTLGMSNEDPVWPLPLWQPYLKEMNSSVADINNVGSGKAGAVHGALFLQQFVEPSVPWIHMDCYAWEQSGKPGRPAGGADTGLRAVLHLIEKRYAV